MGFRSYLWANIALDKTTRLTKLVHMSIGGLGSIAAVSIFRQLGWLHFGFVPQWAALSQELSLVSVATLPLPVVTNLIVTQSLIALLGGVVVGSLRIICFGDEPKERKNLNDPWEELEYQTAYTQRLTVVTNTGEQITGKLHEIGNAGGANDLILTEPTATSESDGQGRSGETELGRLSYHHERDIARIYLHNEWEAHSRGIIERQHRSLLNRGLSARRKATGPLISLVKLPVRFVWWISSLIIAGIGRLWDRDPEQPTEEPYDIESTLTVDDPDSAPAESAAEDNTTADKSETQEE